MKNEWKLVGFDAFEGEYYLLVGDYSSELEARQAGVLRFRLLNETQPPEQSGGQCDLGIQDRIFIKRPDGSKYRFIPLPEDFNQNHP